MQRTAHRYRLTVTDALPETPPEDAVIVAVPAPTAVALPLEPFTEITDTFDDDQMKVAGMLVPEELRITALKFSVVPTVIAADDGETVIDVVAPPDPPELPPVDPLVEPELPSPGPAMPAIWPLRRVSPQAEMASAVVAARRNRGNCRMPREWGKMPAL